MHIILCAIQCTQGFFHSTKGTDSVIIPASAQRYHPRSLFQAKLPSNITAFTLQSCLRLSISHISPSCGLCKQLYSSICRSYLPSLLSSGWFNINQSYRICDLPVSQTQLWTAHHSPSSSIASLPYLRCLSSVLASHAGPSSLDITCNSCLAYLTSLSPTQLTSLFSVAPSMLRR